MNPNTEYERFTQEIYQQLVNLDVVRTTTVQHDVKLEGRSGFRTFLDFIEDETGLSRNKIDTLNLGGKIKQDLVHIF